MGQSNNFHKKYCKNVEKRQHKVSLNFNFFSYCSLLVSLAYSAQAAVRTTRDRGGAQLSASHGDSGQLLDGSGGLELGLALFFASICKLLPSWLLLQEADHLCVVSCISLSLLSSGVFSVPEVFLRIGWLSASKC